MNNNHKNTIKDVHILVNLFKNKNFSIKTVFITKKSLCLTSNLY